MNRAERDEFIGKLQRWKHEGCSVLVVGEVLDLLRETSDLLLGDDDRERYRVFVLTDADPGSVSARLGDASPADLRQRTRVLDYETVPRSTAAEPGTVEHGPAECGSVDPGTVDPGTAERGTVEPVPSIPVSGGLDRLYDELTRTTDVLGSDDFSPSALRVSVDTLRPLLAQYDRDAVGHWLAHVGNATKSYRGTAHYLLPKAYASETVQDLRECVDAVIEVGSYDDAGADRKERWHVPGADLTTPWRPMDGTARGMM